MSSEEAKNAEGIPEQREQKILVSESIEPGRASQVRKSFAWDSAFFTSAGVLDPEELCIINRGFEKSEPQLVAKIRQDQRKRRSVDIEDTLTNQSIEGGLFEDVRASIQRSSIMSRVCKSDCKSGISEAQKHKARTLKKLDDGSQNRVKSRPISRRQSIYTQGSERSKDVLAHSQIVQHAARNGEPSLFFHKPFKILRMMNQVSAGKTKNLLGADPVKMEKKTVSSGSRQGLTLSKRSDFGTSHCSTSSMISPKSSSLLSATASNDSTASCSPSFKFSSNSREKIDSRKTRLSSTGSTSKTLLRRSPGSKKGLRNHGSSKHYSYASPVSSINGWSSQSSSTSAKHCLEASLCTNNSSQACLHNVATKKLHLQSDQWFVHQKSQQTKFLNQCIDEVKGTDDASEEPRINLRPSGLRMPSPRIGYFDEEKSPVLSVSGVLLGNINQNEDLKIIRTMSSQEAENAEAIPGEMEQKLLVSESMDPGRASEVRKSLDWDIAFFTSAGVLDPEELCIINRGFEKSEPQLVAKIRQDQLKRRSVDIEDTLTNQSIEGDLFEDVRASIQRSSIMSSVYKSGCKSGISEAHKQKARNLKKLDDGSQKRVKSMSISRRQSIYTQGSERTKEVVAHSQIIHHAARNGESSLFFRKPSKILRTMNPVSAGKAKILLGADSVKMEKKNVSFGSRQGLARSKRSDFGTSRCSTSSMISPKSSSLLSVTASNDSIASCSPSFKFTSNSRKIIDSKKTRFSATGSTSKTPLRCSPGSKKGLRNHCSSNHYSYASPVSSVNGWSSQSSSTFAKHCLEASLCTNNSSQACLHNVATQKLHLQSHPRDQWFDHQEIQQTKFLNQCIDEVKGTDDASADPRRNLRPSGLRMPSPRIGYFDEEKSPVLAVSGGLQLNFGAHSVLSNTNGEDLDKSQTASVIAVKGGSEPTGVIMARYAARTQEQEESQPTLKNCPWKPSKVESHISQLCRENFSRSMEVSDGEYDKRKIGLNYSSKEERERTEEMMKNEMVRDSKRCICLKGSTIHSGKAEPLVHSEGLNPSNKGNGRARGHHHHLENILHEVHKDEKENLSTLDDHVNGLGRYFESIDVCRDTEIDLNGTNRKGLCNPIFGSNFTKMETTSVEVIPNTRTPLADINSVCTGAESFGFTTG